MSEPPIVTARQPLRGSTYGKASVIVGAVSVLCFCVPHLALLVSGFGLALAGLGFLECVFCRRVAAGWVLGGLLLSGMVFSASWITTTAAEEGLKAMTREQKSGGPPRPQPKSR